MDTTNLKFALLLEIFVAVSLLQNASLNNAATMKFTNYVCENKNAKIIEIHQCRLKAVKRDIVTLNFNATLLQPVHRMRIEAELFKKANGYKPWLYKFDVDACRFLRKGYNPIALFIAGDFLRFSNFNHSCPYEGQVFLQGWYPKPEVYSRLSFPTGDYLVDSKAYFNEKLTINVKYYISYVEES